MPKSGKIYKRGRNAMKTIKNTFSRTLPVVNNSLEKVGTVSKDVVTASIPVVEKGVSAVYNTMAKSADFGVNTAKSLAKSVRTRSRGSSRKGGKRRSRTRKGGKSRRH